MYSDKLPKFVNLHKNHKLRLKLGFYAAPSNVKVFSKAIKDELDKLKFTYCRELNGLVMGFGKISSNEVIPADIKHSISVAVDVDVFIFQPPIGSIIKAIVNQTSDNHVSCLVYNLFNVSIVRPEDKPYDQWLGSKIKENDTINVKVISLDLTKRLPHITGDIVDNENSDYPKDEDTISVKCSIDESINYFIKSIKDTKKEDTTGSSKLSSSSFESLSDEINTIPTYTKESGDKFIEKSLENKTLNNKKGISSPLFSSTPISSSEHTVNSINLIRNKQLEKMHKHLSKFSAEKQKLSVNLPDKYIGDNFSPSLNISKYLKNDDNNDNDFIIPTTTSSNYFVNSNSMDKTSELGKLQSDSGISDDENKQLKCLTPIINNSSSNTSKRSEITNLIVNKKTHSSSESENESNTSVTEQNLFVIGSNGNQENPSEISLIEKQDLENSIYTQRLHDTKLKSDEKTPDYCYHLNRSSITKFDQLKCLSTKNCNKDNISQKQSLEDNSTKAENKEINNLSQLGLIMSDTESSCSENTKSSHNYDGPKLSYNDEIDGSAKNLIESKIDNKNYSSSSDDDIYKSLKKYISKKKDKKCISDKNKDQQYQIHQKEKRNKEINSKSKLLQSSSYNNEKLLSDNSENEIIKKKFQEDLSSEDEINFISLGSNIKNKLKNQILTKEISPLSIANADKTLNKSISNTTSSKNQNSSSSDDELFNVNMTHPKKEIKSSQNKNTALFKKEVKNIQQKFFAGKSKPIFSKSSSDNDIPTNIETCKKDEFKVKHKNKVELPSDDSTDDEIDFIKKCIKEQMCDKIKKTNSPTKIAKSHKQNENKKTLNHKAKSQKLFKHSTKKEYQINKLIAPDSSSSCDNEEILIEDILKTKKKKTYVPDLTMKKDILAKLNKQKETDKTFKKKLKSQKKLKSSTKKEYENDKMISSVSTSDCDNEETFIKNLLKTKEKKTNVPDSTMKNDILAKYNKQKETDKTLKKKLKPQKTLKHSIDKEYIVNKIISNDSSSSSNNEETLINSILKTKKKETSVPELTLKKNILAKHNKESKTEETLKKKLKPQKTSKHSIKIEHENDKSTSHSISSCNDDKKIVINSILKTTKKETSMPELTLKKNILTEKKLSVVDETLKKKLKPQKTLKHSINKECIDEKKISDDSLSSSDNEKTLINNMLKTIKNKPKLLKNQYKMNLNVSNEDKFNSVLNVPILKEIKKISLSKKNEAIVSKQFKDKSSLIADGITTNATKTKTKRSRDSDNSFLDDSGNVVESPSASINHLKTKKRKKDNLMTLQTNDVSNYQNISESLFEVKKKKKKAKHNKDINLNNDYIIKDIKKQPNNLETESKLDNIQKKEENTPIKNVKKKKKKSKVDTIQYDSQEVTFEKSSKTNDKNPDKSLKIGKIKRSSKKNSKELSSNKKKSKELSSNNLKQFMSTQSFDWSENLDKLYQSLNVNLN